jgi:hypothetical protein
LSQKLNNTDAKVFVTLIDTQYSLEEDAMKFLLKAGQQTLTVYTDQGLGHDTQNPTAKGENLAVVIKAEDTEGTPVHLQFLNPELQDKLQQIFTGLQNIDPVLGQSTLEDLIRSDSLMVTLPNRRNAAETEITALLMGEDGHGLGFTNAGITAGQQTSEIHNDLASRTASEKQWISLYTVDETYFGGKEAVLTAAEGRGKNRDTVLRERKIGDGSHLEVRQDFLAQVVAENNLRKKPVHGRVSIGASRE